MAMDASMSAAYSAFDYGKSYYDSAKGRLLLSFEHILFVFYVDFFVTFFFVII